MGYCAGEKKRGAFGFWKQKGHPMGGEKGGARSCVNSAKIAPPPIQKKKKGGKYPPKKKGSLVKTKIKT